MPRQVIIRGKVPFNRPGLIEPPVHYQGDLGGWYTLALVADDAKGLGIVEADSHSASKKISAIDPACLVQPMSIDLDGNVTPTPGESPRVPYEYFGLPFVDLIDSDPLP